ncbi:DUF1176 domain-containing protein [Sphingomonas soli]|uniref:DUF1176 domain-containing protein n=1 Tax=Sphingomonas soli TaxID=266127 RepID=UPI000833E532|nr:DUF1176 domain-containing protein [Sphingomonas soli]
MLSLLLALAAQTPPQEQVFDDWAVACDNVGRCEATALQAPEQLGTAPSQTLLTREADGTLSIAIDPADPVRGPVILLVDGKQVASGTVGENYRVSGAPAEALATAMAAGNWLELRSDARTLGRISLAGMAATLNYIKAEQRGGAAPLPVVPALRTARAAPESPTRAVLGELAKLGNCDLSLTAADLPVERYRLDAATTLVLIPCGSGAYNFNAAAFVLRSGKGAPAEFDVAPDWMEGDDPAILTNASFGTTEGGVLTSSSKGRGIGDCGTSQSWVWDGSRFRMIEARVLGECRGSVNWLTVFRARPEWR